MTIEVRAINQSDEADWRRLWRGYLDFYETDCDASVTRETLLRLVNDDRYFGRIAFSKNQPAGFVHCIFHPSTWAPQGYCYLEDLFVAPAVRGQGVGEALMRAAYQEADRRGAARVYWHTHKDNRTAMRLYDRLATRSDFVQYRREK